MEYRPNIALDKVGSLEVRDVPDLCIHNHTDIGQSPDSARSNNKP